MGGALLGVGRSAPPPNNACCDGRRACDARFTHTNCAHTRHIPHAPSPHAHVQVPRAYTKPRTNTPLCGCSRRSLTGVRRRWHSTTTSVRSLSLAPMARCEHGGSDAAGSPRPPRHGSHGTVSAQMSQVPARLLWRADVVVSPGAGCGRAASCHRCHICSGTGVTPVTSAPGTGLQIAILVVDDSNTPGLKGYTLAVRTCITVPDSRSLFHPPAAPKLRGPVEYPMSTATRFIS